MKLASTLQRAAPTDKCRSSLNVLDSIDQWRPLFERSALGVAMIDSGFHFLVVLHRALPDLQRMKLLLFCCRVVGTEVGILFGAIKPDL
jgi:hypothetical protein